MKLSYELLVCCFAYLGISSVCSMTEGGYVFSPCTDTDMLSSSRCLLLEAEVGRECDCQSLCDEDDRCVVMFFSPDTKKCRLYDQHEDQIVATGMECARIVDCGIPDVDDNMNVTYTSTTYGSELKCAIGYVSTTEDGQSVCQDSGKWSNPTGVCKPIVDCGIPYFPGMDADNTSTTYGSVIEIKCAPLYNSVTTDIQSVCQENGKWSNPTGVCKLISIPTCVVNTDCVLLSMQYHCYGGVCRCNIGFGFDGVTCRILTECPAFANTVTVYKNWRNSGEWIATKAVTSIASCSRACVENRRCKYAGLLKKRSCYLKGSTWFHLKNRRISNGYYSIQRDCNW